MSRTRVVRFMVIALTTMPEFPFQNFRIRYTNNQKTKINHLLQIKKNNENHYLYSIIQNSKIAKVKKKYFHFKIFKYDSFLPYEDKPPENLNSLPYTFFK